MSPQWVFIYIYIYLYISVRGEKIFFHSPYPDNIRCFKNIWRLRRKTSTSSAQMMSSCILLYTQINPNTLGRSISRKDRSRMSTSCLLCILLSALVLRRGVVANFKNALKCSVPLPRAHRWIIPSIAMSRRLSRGAKLNWSSASSLDSPSSAKKLSCNLFKGAIAVSHVW